MARAGFLVLLITGVAWQTGTVPVGAQEPEEVDCENTSVQMELNYCAEKDYQEADARLNEYWKAARQAASRKDVDLGPDDGGAEKLLLDAQRAWLVYRDNSCDLEGFSARGGSMEAMLVSGCKAKLTRQRTDELKAIMEMFQQ